MTASSQVSQLALLEGFGLCRAGSPVVLPAGTQRLLAFLALHGTCHRSVVAGTLWPEVSEVHALARLRTGVWRLSKVVPGLVVPPGPALALSDAVEVDSRRQEAFATALLRGQLDDQNRLRAELSALWPGELLPGWYDDWVVRERERLSELRVRALEVAAVRLLLDHQLDTARQLALEAVRTDPLRETATAVLMRVHLAEGNAADAVTRYVAFVGRLRRELGLEPSARLTRLLPETTRVVTLR